MPELEIENVALTDILSAPTKHRQENSTEDQAASVATLDNGDFDFSEDEFPDDDTLDGHLKKQDPKKKRSPEPEEEEEEDEDFDPEESARAAIDIIDVIQQSILLPWSGFRLLKRYGGREELRDIKAIFEKSVQGKKLDEEEQEKAAKYRAYEARRKELLDIIPFKDVDEAALKPSTIHFCEKNGIKVNQNLAFFAGITKVMSSRVIDILMD